jgi:hypothetical protein
VVKAGDNVIHSSDFSTDEGLFPGGCGANGVKRAAKCTPEAEGNNTAIAW